MVENKIRYYREYHTISQREVAEITCWQFAGNLPGKVRRTRVRFCEWDGERMVGEYTKMR